MKVIFLGGDLRQKYACDFLNKNNIQSECYTRFTLDETIKNKIYDADLICLPIPSIKNDIYLDMVGSDKINVKEIVSCANRNAIFFGAKFTDKIINFLQISKHPYVDYFDAESFQIQNARLTAEGAIYYAKQRFDRSIYGLDIVILGFGRIGKILAYLLHSQGTKITICTRKESDFAWCKLMGFQGVRIQSSSDMINLKLINNKCDLIFNTIPFWIMQEEFVKNIDSNTIIIDLASYPFGIDEALVKKYNLNYYRELGIPGRYSPQSAGEIIGNIIINNLSI